MIPSCVFCKFSSLSNFCLSSFSSRVTSDPRYSFSYANFSFKVKSPVGFGAAFFSSTAGGLGGEDLVVSFLTAVFSMDFYWTVLVFPLPLGETSCWLNLLIGVKPRTM